MSRCPSCNADEAYVSILSVECVNVKCAHYSQKQKEQIAELKAKEKADNKNITGSSPPKIIYRYYDDYDSIDGSNVDVKLIKDFDPYDWIDEHYNREPSD